MMGNVRKRSCDTVGVGVGVGVGEVLSWQL